MLVNASLVAPTELLRDATLDVTINVNMKSSKPAAWLVLVLLKARHLNNTTSQSGKYRCFLMKIPS